MKSESVSRSVVSDSWRPHGLQPTRLLRPWDFPGKRTGVGCHCLLLKLMLCYYLPIRVISPIRLQETFQQTIVALWTEILFQTLDLILLEPLSHTLSFLRVTGKQGL